MCGVLLLLDLVFPIIKDKIHNLGFEFLFLENVQPKNKRGKKKKKEIKLRGVTGKSVQEPRVDPTTRPIAQKK